MPRQIEAERATVPTAVRGYEVCRMHGAGGGAPRGNRNAVKHGEFTAEGLAMKKQINTLARLARQTMAAIEKRNLFNWTASPMGGSARTNPPRDRSGPLAGRL
jgi:hypothetical protein